MLHRTHRGLSQRDLARAVGGDASSVARWETGSGIPNRRAVRRLEEYFGVKRF